MRSFEEVGRLKNVPDNVNEAYRTYASIYLDFCDDNMGHFMWRDIDIWPITKLEEKGIEPNDEDIFKSYLDEATEIAKTTLSGGYWKSLNDLYKEYPLLKSRAEDFEALFYENSK